ncbi:translation factor GTPase family protein [Clostridium boliviensis]|uniref:Translation factor GTPase family protein n=1 Tax=Clostridium boliviensis TaxID=318465 RepID=A0ABU4GT34_9CLOT|nr:translation factor GTPase family protein [Clostridium boliviensis]MDW2800708.1 translation factor GTPase family protein [Clostridium boliviensis]
MKQLTIGILAHVDAGKTTLSEGILYVSGKIGKPGRVDNKNTFLDTYELEKARGITIFSKQAVFDMGGIKTTLLDTPGHVDFSAEMERTLRVLDYAILVISGADGVQGHTRTLWRLLSMYQIPVYVFINKMDQPAADKDRLMSEVKKQLHDSCIDFSLAGTDSFYDQLAMCSESMMDEYLETGAVSGDQIRQGIKNRTVFPCFLGSALKLQGIEALLAGISQYAIIPEYSGEFGAKIFKITRDDQGNRLTHLKLTGGTLSVKNTLTNGTWEEKVNQIRIYSGEKYETVNEISPGCICAVTGLSQTRPGEGLGFEEVYESPVLEPVLSYQIALPEGCNPRQMIPRLRQLEEEEPELHIVWDEHLQEIQAQIMGEIQIEILKSLISDRFGVEVSFDTGRIVYKETIDSPAEGVGHFEPLRHYAEVHLLLEPGEPGSGLEFCSACSEELLGKNYQRLVLTHLEEKSHKGVLTGSAITDMRITLVSGKAHQKHTEGGDFREATYRAVRQGLKEAQSVLLEPYYGFTLELPENLVGRAMTDIEKMWGTCEISHTDGAAAVLTGSAPVSAMRNYQKEVSAYSKGMGRLFCTLKGYEPCHNPEFVIRESGYDSESDLDNPAGSVFCSHGAGFVVPWDQVKKHMHVEPFLKSPQSGTDEETVVGGYTGLEAPLMSLEEIDRIIESTFYANRGKRTEWKRKKPVYEVRRDPVYHDINQAEQREEYLLVDGYNIVFAWPELAELAQDNMDGARMKLLDQLCNYQAIRKCKIIAVFDAYRVKEHREEFIAYHNIHLVYTREAQTADHYIERFAHDNNRKYRITVATSDGLQQMIVRGAGCALLSARELKIEMEAANKRVTGEFQDSRPKNRNFLLDSLSDEAKEQLKDVNSKE